MIRIDGTTGDVRSNVGRRLAERHTSGITPETDREDSPLQSKRSSMLRKKNIKNLIVSCCCCCNL